jgi:hypothetical protein
MVNIFSRGSIKNIADTNSRMPTDLDNFRSKYIDKDINNGIIVEFPCFEISVFEKYRYFLLSSSTLVDFKPRFFMRPDYVSYDYYNTEIYWPLILYLNDKPCIEEFIDMEQIIVPSLSSIIELTNTYGFKNLKKTLTYAEPTNYTVDPAYEKEFAENINSKKITSTDFKNAKSVTRYTNELSIVEYRDEFILTQSDLNSKYVDLTYVPTNLSSISLYLYPYINTPLRYSYDYTIIYSDGEELKRLSWSPNDIAENSDSVLILKSGLSSILKVNSKLIAKYTKQEIKKIKIG